MLIFTSSPNLSKRMNRLVQNFGKRFVKEKLDRFRELYGIEVVEVNPAYSSKECSSCGYVDNKNRKDTHTFECKACGRKINAQVNASRNLLRRSSLKDFLNTNLPKRKVLKVLLKQYLERLKGCWSAPLELLEEFLNPRQGSPSRVGVHGSFVHAEGNSITLSRKYFAICHRTSFVRKRYFVSRDVISKIFSRVKLP